VRVINKKLLASFSGPGRCEYCKRFASDRDAHHIILRGHGGGSRLDLRWNIISLCTTFAGGDNCHHLAHNGREITKVHLFAVVAMREDCNQDDIEGVLNAINLMPKSPREDEIKAKVVNLTTSGLALFRKVWEEITGVRS
jgi:hypothetical protein